MMGFFVGGLFVFCILTYLVFMFLFPEWVGISKKPENETKNKNEPEKAESIAANKEEVTKEV